MTTEHAAAGLVRTGADALARVRVPGDATLVPGVAGRGHDAAAAGALVDELRAALRDAVGVRVVVDGADDAAAAAWTRPVPDPGAQGVDAAAVAWRFTGNDDAAAPRAGVAATVALLALGAAGWDTPVEVLDVPSGHRAARAGAVVHVERAC
ncbi:hypothetical protein ACFT5B_12820 [Luteimicrobium sp. NPDC057192]|uniref:hypothetical protein n=1 Tax=Luteimicrobium sp. NPDC057192 TaxID=3346042 RepID=UPI00363B3E0A